MQTYYRIIPPSGEAETREAFLAKEPGYAALKALLDPIFGGAYFEHVNVLHDGQHLDMFVDEDGHNKRLPRNETATAIYRAAWLDRHPGEDPESLSFIVGPAVLFLRRVWF